LANRRGVSIAALGLRADRIAGLAGLIQAGKISAQAAGRVAEAMLESDSSPEALAQKMGVIQVRDGEQMAAWVEQAIAANPDAVQTVLNNPKKAAAAEGFLRGQVMRISGGRADPKLAGELIAQRIDGIRTSIRRC